MDLFGHSSFDDHRVTGTSILDGVDRGPGKNAARNLSAEAKIDGTTLVAHLEAEWIARVEVDDELVTPTIPDMSGNQDAFMLGINDDAGDPFLDPDFSDRGQSRVNPGAAQGIAGVAGRDDAGSGLGQPGSPDPGESQHAPAQHQPQPLTPDATVVVPDFKFGQGGACGREGPPKTRLVDAKPTNAHASSVRSK